MKILRVLFLLLLVSPTLALAQRPLSGDLQISTDTHVDQGLAHVATHRSGGFVVTWVSTETGGGHSLHAARFHADGSAATGEILVSSQALGVAANSAAALMDDGSFAVVFPVAEGSSLGLRARWYNPDGSPDGAEAAVASNTSMDYSISTRGDGGLVVAWEKALPSVAFRVFSPEHGLGAETLVDASGTDPVVAVGPQGGFVMAWRHGQIVGRRFTSVGAPSGRRFVIDPGNNGAGAGSGNLHLGKEEDGDFVVLWGAGPTVFGRRFKSDATPVGGLIRVQAGAGYDAAIGGQGNFVLVWTAPDAGSPDETNVFARRFKFDGSPLGPQLRVNERVKGSQEYPQVGIGADGGFTVVWRSRSAGSSSDVFARLFERK